MKIEVGNGTERGKCKVCGKVTGDFIVKRGKEHHCCFECVCMFKN